MSSPIVDHQQHIARWRESGLSRAAYCRQHGIVYHTTKRWNRPFGTPPIPPSADSGFIEVLRPAAVIATPSTASAATVSWPTGATLRIPAGADPQWIGRIITAVRPC